MKVNQVPDGVIRAVQRAETPYVLFSDDIATVFRLKPEQALTSIRLGLLGPWFLVQGEPAVLRDTLREHLRLRMAQRYEGDKELIPAERSGFGSLAVEGERGG